MHSSTSAFSKRTGISAAAFVRVIKPTLCVPVLGQDGPDFGVVLACGCSPVRRKRRLGWCCRQAGEGCGCTQLGLLFLSGGSMCCCLQGRKEGNMPESSSEDAFLWCDWGRQPGLPSLLAMLLCSTADSE